MRRERSGAGRLGRSKDRQEMATPSVRVPSRAGTVPPARSRALAPPSLIIVVTSTQQVYHLG